MKYFIYICTALLLLAIGAPLAWLATKLVGLATDLTNEVTTKQVKK